MSMIQKIFSIFFLYAVFTSASFGTTRLYISNNSSVIPLKKAYERLMSSAETDLERNIIPVLQKNHAEQGQFHEALGVYQMSSSQQITADNSVVFGFSPFQTIKKAQLTLIAKELAETFDQDSVAVISLNKNNYQIIDRVVSFKDRKPYLSDVILKIKEQLPYDYQIAYTLYIDGKPESYKQARVSKIEWIGKNLSTQELQLVFFQASIKESKGNAWLIYKDGKVQEI